MKRLRLVVLLLCTAILTISGCARYHGMGPHGSRDTDYPTERGLKEMTALIEKTVQDPEKAKRVQAIVEEIVAEARQSHRQNREYHQKLYELNTSYDAAPEEFTKILDELNTSRMRTASKILALRFKMKDLLTAQEWKAFTDEMNKVRSRYGPRKETTDSGRSGG